MKIIKTLTIITILIVTHLQLSAQEHKVEMSSGKVKVHEVDELNVKGHDKSFILIKSSDYKGGKSERAKGLRPINSLGLTDNTGIGLSVQKEGSELIVRSVSRNNDSRYTIFVPKGVTFYYEHSTHHGDDLNIENVQSEIHVSLNHNSVYLKDVTGPMTINTVHGDVEAKFSTVSQNNPISIASAHGHIDVALPEATKANMRLSSNWGEIFTDLNIDVEKSGDMRKISSSVVKGKINGGGVDISLSSTHSDVYLRKRK